jgi:predicted ester cyclase
MSEEPLPVVRRYYDEVFGQRNLAALDELIAPDFTGYSPGYGPFTIEEMRRSIAREQADMPEDETIVEEQIAAGDRVVTRWRYRWKHTASVFGEAPSGDWIEMEGVHIDRVADGKIVDRWEIKDFMGVARRLGATVTFPGEQPEP